MKINELQNSLMPGAQRKLKLKPDVLGEMDLIVNPTDINMVRDILQTQDNHDVQMAKSDLLQCVQNGMKVLGMMRTMSDSDNLEAWVQEKIIKASDYLNTIREYLEGRIAQSHFQFGEGVNEGEDLSWDDPDLVKFRELLAKREKEKSKIKSTKRNGHTEFKGIDKEIERQRKKKVSEVYDGDPGEYFVLRHQTKFDIEREMPPKAWTRVKQFDGYQAAKKEYEAMKAKYPNDKFTVTTHMKKQEQMSEESELDVKTLSLSDIAKKHNVSSGELLSQLRKGIKVELEHTSDLDVAKEIALDHLSEFPDYYDKLERVETSEEMMTEAEKDACYRKVKSRYKVWPSAYASGALVKCRKVGAKNWGNKKKASESVTEMDYGGGKNPYAGHGLSKDDDESSGKEIIVKPVTKKFMAKDAAKLLGRELAKSRDKKGVAEGKKGKKADRFHIVGKDGKPASLASYADQASAVKDRDAKHPGAEVRQVGPRGKIKGVAEGEEQGTFATLKGWQQWNVLIMNNFYNGKYPDYSARMYGVVASSPEEARQVVLDNADYVLKDLLSKKTPNGKRWLPPKSALPIDDDRVGGSNQVKPGSLTTMGFKTILTPGGLKNIKFSNGQIVDIQGEESAVAEEVWQSDYARRRQQERDIESGKKPWQVSDLPGTAGKPSDRAAKLKAARAQGKSMGDAYSDLKDLPGTAGKPSDRAAKLKAARAQGKSISQAYSSLGDKK